MRSINSQAQGALALLLTVAACAGESDAHTGDTRRPFTKIGDSLPRFPGIAYAGTAQSDTPTPIDVKNRRRRRHRSPATSSDTPSTDGASSAQQDTYTSTPTYAMTPPASAPQRRFLPIPRASLVPATAAPSTVPVSTRHLPQLFVGQLKKNAAAESLQAILALLAPHVTPVHIEPLYNRTTGQGRGCAWLYLRNMHDANAVLELHHRVFLDTDAATGGIGLWVCDCRGEEELRAFADTRIVDDYVQRKKKLLPRQPLVVEHAARTMPQMAPPMLPAAPEWEPWEASVAPAPSITDAAAIGPFPRAYPNEGVVLVAPRRYRHDPYLTAAPALLPACGIAVPAYA